MLNCVYDLAVSPPTFDFVSFLVACEIERIHKKEDSIKVYIVSGPDNGFRKDNLPPRDPELRWRMLGTIVVPMCQLLPSCSGVDGVEAHEVEAHFPRLWSKFNRVPCYGTKLIMSAAKHGLCPLTIGERIKDENLITITLRQAHYWPSRNSNVEAWHAAAQHLQDKGYEVRIIPDEATVKRPGFIYDKEAEFDLIRRSRLYERARLNLFVNGGPGTMALAMKNVRALRFMPLTDKAPCSSANFWEQIGYPVGTQVREDHRFVWANDDEKTIISEVEKELNV